MKLNAIPAFLNCKVTHKGYGHFKCVEPLEDPPYCDISCQGLPEWEPVPLKRYPCVDENYGKTLPRCAKLAKAGMFIYVIRCIYLTFTYFQFFSLKNIVMKTILSLVSTRFWRDKRFTNLPFQGGGGEFCKMYLIPYMTMILILCRYAATSSAIRMQNFITFSSSKILRQLDSLVRNVH